MTIDEKTERWKKLKGLRWSIILLFVLLAFFNKYPGARDIPFMSSAAVALAYLGAFVQFLLIPSFIFVAILERRARLSLQPSDE
jgi:hypothetical protein